MSLVYILDLEVLNAGTLTPATLRYSYKQQVTVGADTYKPFLLNPGLFGQSIDIGAGFGGNFSSTLGEITLLNHERVLDSVFSNYVTDGGKATLSLYDTVALTTTAIFVKAIEQIVFEWDKLSVRLQSESDTLGKPLQTKVFLGDNVLPAGVEGLNELTDKRKPLVLGRVTNFTPALVNTSKLIYQLSSEPVEQVVSVMSNGSYLTPGTGQSSLANLLNDVNTPAAGYFSWYSGSEGAFIRVGMESGDLTCTAWEKTNPISNTAAELVKRVLTLAGYTSANWVAGDFTALDAVNADSLGLFISGEETTTEVLDKICQSVGTWWGFDSAGLFRLYFVSTSTATSVANLAFNPINSQTGITSFELSAMSYNGQAKRCTEVKLNYDKNWTVQDKSSLAGIVVTEYPDRATWLGKEFRQVIANTATVYKNTQSIEYDTYLVSEFAATREAWRRQGIMLGYVTRITCSARLTLTELKALYPGAHVTVTLPRFNFDAGNECVVLSVEVDYELLTANLTLLAL